MQCQRRRGVARTAKPRPERGKRGLQTSFVGSTERMQPPMHGLVVDSDVPDVYVVYSVSQMWRNGLVCDLQICRLLSAFLFFSVDAEGPSILLGAQLKPALFRNLLR
ncbi:hypothetical protein CAOG_009579 [Capsaspora owczarzaki ATCC 30864]|uniref:Uncharacterized protein n=1 Tax=Capsaspora owczarzaki (strain ATCC 30864) TaxID=595528 RepID=A0A0D2X1Z0_CAPO3|nr:hypothetical protein CAOG_009579 [Capsaspora owczarzaki ATCC 30864]